MRTSYELFRLKRDGFGVSVTLTIEDNELTIADCSYGDVCETFFGGDEHDYIVSVDRKGAIAILKKLRLPKSKHPTQSLGEWLVKELAGCNEAATKFERIASRAGVEAKTSVW